MIELALPAGTLENAIVAFEHGADAVYFGLKDFSARKGAGNFSFEDLSKIREYSLRNNKKIYITINTLIDDETLPRLYETLDRVSYYGCDGIICQDLGVARLIKRDFKNLPLHGSTQIAVHTQGGVRELQRLGFERVVLSRELSIEEIKRIRIACPDVELKVFIHGALCYGFSGLCMASYLKTGRSANEGSCAQVCRTWFELQSSKEKLCPFSLKDMEAGELVRELDRIGIDSLKVEGRLKGNEYVAAVADYYRAIIDNNPIGDKHSAVQSSFQRVSCTGYLDYNGPFHRNLNTGLYTGHIGEEVGVVVSVGKKTINVRVCARINPYDGLMVLKTIDGLVEPIRFSSHILRREKDTLVLLVDSEIAIDPGDRLYRISNSALRIKTPSLNISGYKPSIDISITIADSSISINGMSYDIAIEESESGEYEKALERIFKQAGDASFNVGRISIENNSRFDSPFMRLSDLKRIRRDCYSKLKPEEMRPRIYEIGNSKKVTSITLPDRTLLSSERFIWNIEGSLIDGICYITIPPVTYDEETLFERVEKSAKAHDRVRIGLNNIAHLNFACKHPEYEYFADIYLYLSNRESARLLVDENINIIGGYLWLERDSHGPDWPFTPTIVSDAFNPPLFISRSCFRHDSLNLDCKGCTHHHSFKVIQNNQSYDVFVDDCQSVVSIAKNKGQVEKNKS